MPTSSYCWDTRVFLSLLIGSDDGRSGQEALGLRAAVDDIRRDRVMLVTSTLIFAEVLPGSLDPEQYDVFARLFERENVEARELTATIARLAGDVRTRGFAQGMKTSAEDAVFVATALSVGSEYLHSYDPHHLRLAELFQDELVISKPTGTQASMDLDAEPEQ